MEEHLGGPSVDEAADLSAAQVVPTPTLADTGDEHLRWTASELADLLLSLDDDLTEEEIASWGRDELIPAIFAILDADGVELLCKEAVASFWGFKGSAAEWDDMFNHICKNIGANPDRGLDLEEFKTMLDGDWAQMVYDDDGEILKRFLVEADIALVKVQHLKDLASKGRRLPSRQQMPDSALVTGSAIAALKLWPDKVKPPRPGYRRLFVLSHAWLTEEHPDPSGLRLRELMATLKKVGASAQDVVFLDYSSLYQVDRMHPDLKEKKELPPGHPALRTLEQDQKFKRALVGMDKLYASAVSHVIVLKKIYTGRNSMVEGFAKSENKFLKRLWCRVELSIAQMFGRIINEDQLPELPKNRDPAAILKMIDFGEIVLTDPSDKQPLMEIYKRYYYASCYQTLITHIRRSEAAWHMEGIQGALNALHFPIRHDVVLELGRARALAPFAPDVVRLMMDWRSIEYAVRALEVSKGDEEVMHSMQDLTHDKDWRVRLTAICALDILDPVPKASSSPSPPASTSPPPSGPAAEAAAIAAMAAVAASSRAGGATAGPGGAGGATVTATATSMAAAATAATAIAAMAWGNPIVRKHSVAAARRSCLEAMRHDWQTQISCIEAVQNASALDDQRSIVVLVALTEAPLQRIRAAAILALSIVASPGSPHAMETLVAALNHDRDWEAQLCILDALDNIDNSGPRPPADARASCSEALLGELRPMAAMAAISALAECAPPGDERSLIYCRALREVPEPGVRLASLRAMVQIAPEGHPDLVSALAVALHDEQVIVRSEAVVVLGRVARASDPRSCTLLLESLKDQNWCIRCKAAKALANLGTGTSEALLSLGAALRYDSNPYVVLEAAKALGRMRSPDDAATVNLFVDVLMSDKRPIVREGIVTLLRRTTPVASGGSPALAQIAIDALLPCLEDPSAKVRKATCVSLMALAPPGASSSSSNNSNNNSNSTGNSNNNTNNNSNNGSKSKNAGSSNRNSSGGAQTAKDSNNNNSNSSKHNNSNNNNNSNGNNNSNNNNNDKDNNAVEGDETKDPLLRGLLVAAKDEDADVRRAAVQAVQKLSPSRDPKVVETLCDLLQDEDGSVRYFSVLALGVVCGRLEIPLRAGQRVEINGVMGCHHQGSQGLIAEVSEEGKPVVLLDSGLLMPFHPRDVTVLSEGVYSKIWRLQHEEEEPNYAVRKAAATVLMQRRNAHAGPPYATWLDLKNPKYNPVCAMSGRIPPAMRKKPTIDPPEKFALDRGRLTLRKKCTQEVVWRPVRLEHAKDFSQSPFLFSPSPASLFGPASPSPVASARGPVPTYPAASVTSAAASAPASSPSPPVFEEGTGVPAVRRPSVEKGSLTYMHQAKRFRRGAPPKDAANSGLSSDGEKLPEKIAAAATAAATAAGGGSNSSRGGGLGTRGTASNFFAAATSPPSGSAANAAASAAAANSVAQSSLPARPWSQGAKGPFGRLPEHDNSGRGISTAPAGAQRPTAGLPASKEAYSKLPQQQQQDDNSSKHKSKSKGGQLSTATASTATPEALPSSRNRSQNIRRQFGAAKSGSGQGEEMERGISAASRACLREAPKLPWWPIVPAASREICLEKLHGKLAALCTE